MISREKKLERALLVIEGLILRDPDLDNQLAGNIYTIAHGALGIGSCSNICPHVVNYEQTINKYIDELKLSSIIDIKKIQSE